jgi:molybdate transport system substrate-binding protein
MAKRPQIALACAALALLCTRVPARAGTSAPFAGGERELVVFAATSLREVFTELGADFMKEHPGVRVSLSFAGSQDLRLQLEQGASADLFASADVRHAKALEDEGLALQGRVFARNQLALVVPRGNPAGLHALRDLPRAKRIVLGALQVPVGAYTAQMLAAADAAYGGQFATMVEGHVVSREANVRQVLAKVALGEADAAVVYRTDAAEAAPGSIEQLEIPAALNRTTEYPVEPLRAARNPQLARAFVELLLSPAGQARLARRGFVAVNPGPQGAR